MRGHRVIILQLITSLHLDPGYLYARLHLCVWHPLGTRDGRAALAAAAALCVTAAGAMDSIPHNSDVDAALNTTQQDETA